MTLSEAQDYVERLAPGPYYRDHYRGYEADYLQDVIDLLLPLGSGRRVLEVGPGWGTLAVWMTDRAHQVTVLDQQPVGTYIAEDLLRHMGIRYVQGAIDEYALPDGISGQFDLVVMTQVIPHLKWRPDAALRHVNHVLATSGRLITSALDSRCYPHVTPAFERWQDVPVYESWLTPVPDVEVCMYTQETFRELLETEYGLVRITQRPGSTTMLAECRRPRGLG